MNRVNSDILIFGSSRSYRHYDPRIISDSLNISCYNCGQSGQGILFNYALIAAILERYQPKLIVYDIYPRTDLILDDHMQYIKPLRPYMNSEHVMDVIKNVGIYEDIKMQSKMYCYNHIVNDIILKYMGYYSEETSYNGYAPLFKTFNENCISYFKDNGIDSLKLLYFEKLASLCKPKQLVFVMSPFWYRIDKKYADCIKEIADSYGIPFFDFSLDKTFLDNNYFFYDGLHLNSLGARKFTYHFVDSLQSIVYN